MAKKKKNKKEQEIKEIIKEELTITHESYRAMKVWCSLMNNLSQVTENKQKEALKESAPIDSIYFSVVKNRWMTINDIKNSNLRERILKEINNF